MKKMTERQIERALANVKATLAIEGLAPGQAVLKSGKSYLQGRITSQEAIRVYNA